MGGNTQMDSESEPMTVEENKGKSWPPFLRGIFWGMVFASTAIVSAALGASFVIFRPFPPYISTPPNREIVPPAKSWLSTFQSTLNRPVNILVMGIEPVLDPSPQDSKAVFSGSSDTLFLLRMDPEEKQLQILLIPRDTQVITRKLKIPKIHRANPEGGAELAVEITSESLNNLTIDGYLRLTTGSLRELLNLLGGVEVFVPQVMSYGEETLDFRIDLQPGWQTLNGEQAELFARFKDSEQGNLARIQRQEVLLKAIYERGSNPKVLPKLPQIVDIMRQYVDTDLTREEIMALVAFSLQEEVKGLQVMLLPGRLNGSSIGKSSYWLPNRKRRDRLLHDYFAGEKTWRYSSFSPPVNRLRIAIENTTENPDLADSVLSYLEDKGFYNAYIIDNSPLELHHTEIIMLSGNKTAAQKLKKVLGLGKIELSSLGDLDSDLTVRVGKDWFQLLTMNEEQEEITNNEQQTINHNE